MTLHNLATAYYAFQLAKWYLSMSVKNMHAVEECEVGNIYDKAKYTLSSLPIGVCRLP